MLKSKEKGFGAPHTEALTDQKTQRLQCIDSGKGIQALAAPMSQFRRLELGFAALGWCLHPLHGESLLVTIPAWGMSRTLPQPEGSGSAAAQDRRCGMNWLHHCAWTWSYRLEEMRERAQAERHLWTQAASCISLAILRYWGC